jgi:putative peptidoglycan lipid II flippase
VLELPRGKEWSRLARIAGIIVNRIQDLLPLFKNSLVRDTAFATGFSLIGKSAGFLVPFFIASWFGAGPATDSFFFAYGVILFLAGVFGPVLETVVPYAAESRKRPHELAGFMSRTLALGTAALGTASLCFLLLVIPLASHLTKFSPEFTALTRALLLEISPLALLLFWTSVLSGYLNAHKRFSIPALAPAARAIVNLIFIFFFRHSLGIHALTLGYIAGEFLRLIVLAAAVILYCPFRLHPVIRPDLHFQRFCRTSFHAMTAMIWVLTNQLVDNTMASWLAPGSVTLLQYAGNLYMIPMNLFSGGILTVLLAYWSNGDYLSGSHRFLEGVHRSVRWVLWVTLPTAGALAILSRGLSHLLLGHGAIATPDIDLVAKIWSAYLIGFPLQAIAQVYVKGLLVAKETSALQRGAFYSVFLNIFGNAILAHWFGIVGIALATSGTAVFSTLYFQRSLRSAIASQAGSAGDVNVSAKP